MHLNCFHRQKQICQQAEKCLCSEDNNLNAFQKHERQNAYHNVDIRRHRHRETRRDHTTFYTDCDEILDDYACFQLTFLQY